MKKCELCKSVARMYCDSDQANLCWDCDSRIHTANFLVAKHIRTLLCHACQSPTPWTGSGPKLGPTVSLCDACVDRTHRNLDDDRDDFRTEDDEDDGDDDEDDGDDDDDDDDDGDDDGDDGENQVVPLSLAPSLASSSSSSGEESSFSTRTTDENARFSYSGMERPEEKKGTQKIRPWTWR